MIHRILTGLIAVAATLPASASAGTADVSAFRWEVAAPGLAAKLKLLPDPAGDLREIARFAGTAKAGVPELLPGRLFLGTGVGLRSDWALPRSFDVGYSIPLPGAEFRLSREISSPGRRTVSGATRLGLEAGPGWNGTKWGISAVGRPEGREIGFSFRLTY
jgi:hypothetical protein